MTQFKDANVRHHALMSYGGCLDWAMLTSVLGLNGIYTLELVIQQLVETRQELWYILNWCRFLSSMPFDFQSCWIYNYVDIKCKPTISIEQKLV